MRDQLVGTDQAGVARAAAEIREASIEHNVFRGKVLSFGQEVFGHGQTLLQFHRRPELGADQLVLAPATLAEIKRQVVDVARHKARLLAAGQHLKRGVLLYGPPGRRQGPHRPVPGEQPARHHGIQLLRRAALVAATRTPDGGALAVSAGDLTAALDELLDTRNAMTRTLLGSLPG
ncbi:hypothetical protein ACI792_03440 [Blastococcus sp. SYSU DS0669]